MVRNIHPENSFYKVVLFRELVVLMCESVNGALSCTGGGRSRIAGALRAK